MQIPLMIELNGRLNCVDLDYVDPCYEVTVCSHKVKFIKQDGAFFVQSLPKNIISTDIVNQMISAISLKLQNQFGD